MGGGQGAGRPALAGRDIRSLLVSDDQPTAALPPPQDGPFKHKTANKLYRWYYWVIGAVAVVLGVMIFAGNLIQANELPHCDSDRAKDTLSDVLKTNKVDAKAYDSIEQVAASDAEVSCKATLSLNPSGKLDLAWRFFWKDKDANYEITQFSQREG